jgi:PAS domain S-box-containing protein
VNEEKFRNLFENSPAGNSMTGMDGSLHVNKALCDMLGYSLKELQQKKWMDITHPDDIELTQSYIQSLVDGSVSQVRFEKRFIHKNDNILWTELSSYMQRDLDGKPLFLISSITNITERKHAEELLRLSEQKYRRLHETMIDGLAYTSMEGKILESNIAFQNLLGYSCEELNSLTYLDITPKKWHAYEKRIIAEQILISGYSKIYEKEYVRRDGTVFPVELRTTLIKNEAGEIEGMWAIIRDITKRKATEKLLKENEIRLYQLNATKDKFFSIIARDLRNPFTTIVGLSNILSDQIKKNDHKGIGKYVEAILNSSKRTMDLLSNLLEWSRSQTGRMSLSIEQVDLTSIMKETTDLLTESATQKSISITIKSPSKVLCMVDKNVINSVLRNLVSNAIKYTHPGGSIVITTEQRINESIVIVKDSGVGMDKNDLENLFRIEACRATEGTREEIGTGLGLILCKEFIDKHGGKIWAESEPGIGSTFFFSIPCGSF